MGTDEGTGHEITESRCLQSAYGLSGTREVGLATLSMDDLEEGSVQSVQAKEKTPLKVPQKSKFQLTVQSMKGAERCYMFGYHMIPPRLGDVWNWVVGKTRQWVHWGGNLRPYWEVRSCNFVIVFLWALSLSW